MGLAASQARFGALTNRKNDIGFQLQRLALQKNSLTRDMRLVTKNYQAAMSAKTLKWSDNAGVSYKDLSYSTLMTPSGNNINSPVLITNSAGKVVVNDKYKQYAEMISPDGAPGGDYASHRNEILKALVGISDEQLVADANTSAELNAKYSALQKADSAKTEFLDKYSKSYDVDSFVKTFLNPSKLGCSGAKVNADNVDSYTSTLINALKGKDYFSADLYKNFENACKESAQTVKNEANADEKLKTVSTIDDFISLVVGNFSDSGSITVMADRNGNGKYTAYEAAVKAYEDAYAAYKTAASAHEEVFTASEERQINYYDKLFQAIVDNGWDYDASVQDSDYLNQKFQNNDYYITTMVDDSIYDPTADGSLPDEYHYDTALATSYQNIFTVNDSDAANEALVEYEYQKSIINEKESRIDTRMKNLETEQSAISKMLESIKQVKNDNIERTFGIWG